MPLSGKSCGTVGTLVLIVVAAAKVAEAIAADMLAL